MYEIEIKAHVLHRTQLLSTLATFATYTGSVRRDDTYYKLIKSDGKSISARIRQETPAQTPEISLPNPVKNALVLTYKRKELKTDTNGVSIEVNDEKECLLSDPEALKSLLLDTGYKVSHTKTKTVIDFSFEGANIEVCHVEKLGDFIEIEILSPSNDPETVEVHQNHLRQILSKCQIPEDQIEERYYSDMLKELQ